MDDLIGKLQALTQKHPENDAIKRLLVAIKTADAASAGPAQWANVRRDVKALVQQQLISEDELKRLGELVPQETGSKDAETTGNFSIVVPPSPGERSLAQFLTNGSALPPELLDTLNHIYFLHLLATNPTSVLPPGKSLVSAMLGAGSTPGDGEDSTPTLRERVEDIVHKAFWSEALEALSTPLPATQLQRLKGLYADLSTTLQPLLPPSHPAFLTLTLPLSPTNAPLRSALLHLSETASALRERCAPARDELLDRLLADLAEPSPHAPPNVLAEKVVSAVRSLLEIAEVMKQDLRGFVLGRTKEADVAAAVRADAQAKEKEVVRGLWSADAIRERWKSWLADADLPPDSTPRRRLVARLVQALTSNSAVGCLLPSSPTDAAPPLAPPSDSSPAPPNALPPPLLFVTPALLRTQNLLQVLTIAAALRVLARLPPAPSTAAAATASAPSAQDEFVQRVWTLLRAEAERDDGTKIAHLADEVIRARKTFSTDGAQMSDEDEKVVRAAVDRTLKPDDQVFGLLRKRLGEALRAALDAPEEVRAARVPESMRAGRERPGKRPRLDDSRERKGREGIERVVVKGFEDVVLARGVGEVLREVRGVVGWVEEVWGVDWEGSGGGA